jgi:hypothetical protein
VGIGCDGIEIFSRFAFELGNSPGAERLGVGEVPGEATEGVFDNGLVALHVLLKTFDYVRDASGPASQHVDEVEGILRRSRSPISVYLVVVEQGDCQTDIEVVRTGVAAPVSGSGPSCRSIRRLGTSPPTMQRRSIKAPRVTATARHAASTCSVSSRL